MPGYYNWHHFHSIYISVAMCCIWLLSMTSLQAQNLAPNYSFEVYTSCPAGGGTGGPMLCPPWVSATGDCDYFHACATNPFYGVPDNIAAYQQARTGLAYPGGHFYLNSNYREYPQAPLLQTLQAGHCYKVGFYLNLANNSCGVNQAGVLLTPNPVSNPLGMTPQIDWNGHFFTDTASWFFVFGYMTAVGNEAYITLGNFYTNAETTQDPSCAPGLAYYFFEDVIVEEITPLMINVEVDGPVSVCDSFVIETTIEPDVADVFYTWSDGSHSPTLTVHESGEYTVTVQYGCNTDEATIEVDIISIPAVNLGEDIILCNGDATTISLDPSQGDYVWQDGSSSTNYIIDQAGEYHVTLDDECDLTHDTIIVTLIDPPSPFSLGQDTFLCPGDELTFTFDPDLGEFQWQDGSDLPTYVINEEGTYSLVISNMCGEDMAQVDVVEVSPPFFDLGPDTASLCTGDAIDISIDPALGDFLWQDGDPNPFYTILEEGMYSVTVTNACGEESDQMYVDVVDQPNIQFGPDFTLCIGDTIILDGGHSTGEFTWHDGSAATTFEVTTSGTYALTVTNDCGFDSDEISIGFMLPPDQPNLGPDVTLCPGDSIILNASSSGAFYIWNDMSTADTLLITEEGIYFVEVFNGCETFYDTVNVSIDNAGPTLTLPADFSICSGQPVVLDAGVTGVSYLWSDGTMSPQLSVSSPGVYALTVSNSCGTDADSVLIGDGGPAPFVSLGIDTSICPGTSIMITPVYADVENWLWHDGTSMISYLAQTAGEVHVTVSNGCGTTYDTMHISLLADISPLSLGMDTTVCAGEPVTLTIMIPDVDIQWSDGTSGSNFIISDSALVYATISNQCGSSSDTMEISLLPDIPILNLGPDQTICPGETILVDPGLQGVDYLWQDGTTGSTMSISQEDLVILMITNECGSNIDSIQITESTDGPQLDLGPDVIACVGETVTIQSNISGVDYVWQDGSQGSSFSTSVSGAYYLDVSNLCGQDSDSINIEISGVPPNTNLGPDTLLCSGAELVLLSTSDSLLSMTWQDGSTASAFTVQTPGVYVLTEVNACGTDSDSIQVTYLDPPMPFNLGADSVICSDAMYFLISPSTAFDILWQDGSALPQILVDETNTYTLQLSNACGVEKDSVHIVLDDVLPVVDLGPDTVWCDGDIIILDATSFSHASYLWSTGEVTSSITIQNPGIYSVEVLTNCGKATDEIEVVADTDCGKEEFSTGIYIPNVFSPNGDQINDFFSTVVGQAIQMVSIEGSIFDRWGGVMYHSNGLSFLWDGKCQGQSVLPGIYVYVFKLKYQVGGEVLEAVLKGDVTVIR